MRAVVGALAAALLFSGCSTVGPTTPSEELGEATWKECRAVDPEAQIRRITRDGHVTFYTTSTTRIGAMERCLNETYARLQREWLSGAPRGAR